MQATPEIARARVADERLVDEVPHQLYVGDTAYDVAQRDATDYLVMEHLEGQTLAARLERGPLKLVDALRYAIEIADALDKAHRAGVVHLETNDPALHLPAPGGLR